MWWGLLCALAAACAYGIASVMQAIAARSTADDSYGVNPGLLVRVLGQWRFLLGLGLDVLGFVAQLAALRVLPLFVVVVLAFALLIAYPWPVLATATIIYLASLPFGFMSYRNHQRRDVSVPAQQPATAPAADATTTVAAPSHPEPPAGPERPARLN